jgi:hypothetical protein
VEKIGREKLCNREEWKKLLRMAMESSHSAHGNGMNKSAGRALKIHFLKQPIYSLRITLSINKHYLFIQHLTAGLLNGRKIYSLCAAN